MLDLVLALVEDAACAVGSEIQGQRIGKPWGAAVCFSFHPRKVISTGEGGMIVTDDDSLADTCRSLRNQGRSDMTGKDDPAHTATGGA